MSNILQFPIPSDISPTAKAKMRIVHIKSANGDLLYGSSIEVFNGVKACNIEKVLSKRRAVGAVFATFRTENGGYRTLKQEYTN